MQGYILHTQRVRDEDLIVTLLTQKSLKTLYRFYGARHATIQIGYKIDFEVQYSAKSSIGQLRHILHLSEKWFFERHRFYIWQRLIRLFYRHLHDIENIDPFYFNLLESMKYRFEKQNPKRTAIEGYLSLLSHEGRLHHDFHCFLCDNRIDGDPALARGFLPAHPTCLLGEPFSRASIDALFQSRSTLYLSDSEVERLWELLLQGL
ncbi:MAG: recombination protein RecO [Campylobacteraceae bacterium 4484_4]|nr:MAG: recombination protein RecO [Campylobacteraceae bacterium 4484_4]